MSKDIRKLECDYLVVGGGATGIAFVDELIHGNRNVKVVLVDKRSKPGGHWVDAYPFVRLHQPATTYGVNSKHLGKGGADLATKAQILAYYELVIDDLMSTGRLQYFPHCEYLGDGKIMSLLDERLEYQVEIFKKTVDATLMLTHVPSTKAPEYAVAEEVNLVPINKLAEVKAPWKRYVVIGAGKTGLDALSYLLDHGVDQERIVWIVSNDSWFFCRDFLEGEKIKTAYKNTPQFFSTILEAENVDDCYKKLEATGNLLRLDKNVWPTKNHAATVSSKEIAQYRTIQNTLRYGRVNRIEKDKIVFKSGTIIPTDSETLHIDCSAEGTNFKQVKEKIFDGNLINLLMVQMPAPCMSGAVIAALENKFPDDEQKKNDCCKPLNAPILPAQWWELNYWAGVNRDKIQQTLGLRWLRTRRLSPLYHTPLIGFIKNSIFMIRNKDKISQKLKLFGEQEDMYGKFNFLTNDLVEEESLESSSFLKCETRGHKNKKEKSVENN